MISDDEDWTFDSERVCVRWIVLFWVFLSYDVRWCDGEDAVTICWLWMWAQWSCILQCLDCHVWSIMICVNTEWLVGWVSCELTIAAIWIIWVSELFFDVFASWVWVLSGMQCYLVLLSWACCRVFCQDIEVVRKRKRSGVVVSSPHRYVYVAPSYHCYQRIFA